MTPGPTRGPTRRPTPSPTDGPTDVPTSLSGPTASPTEGPTASPSTGLPTASPIDYRYLSTAFGGGAGAGAGKGKALLASVGNMFDVKARSDVEISSIGFHTYLTTTMNVTLYVRGGIGMDNARG